MTPARKAALQWFAARGEMHIFLAITLADAPTQRMQGAMERDGQLYRSKGQRGKAKLTDKGRRDLHGG